MKCVDTSGRAFTDEAIGAALGDTIDGDRGADQLWEDAMTATFVLRYGQATGDHILDFIEDTDIIRFEGPEVGAKLREYAFDPATETDHGAN